MKSLVVVRSLSLGLIWSGAMLLVHLKSLMIVWDLLIWVALVCLICTAFVGGVEYLQRIVQDVPKNILTLGGGPPAEVECCGPFCVDRSAGDWRTSGTFLVVVRWASGVITVLWMAQNYDYYGIFGLLTQVLPVLCLWGIWLYGFRLLKSAEHPEQSQPPINAEFLFSLLLDSKNCDALVGDLTERYRLIHQKFGPRKANVWYWSQAIRSVVPIAWAWAKKAALKPVIGVIAWAVAKNLIGHDSWLVALVEMWKKIRS